MLKLCVLAALVLLGACAQPSSSSWPEPTAEQLQRDRERDERYQAARNARESAEREARQRFIREVLQQTPREQFEVLPDRESLVIGADTSGHRHQPGLWQDRPLYTAGQAAAAAAAAARANAQSSVGAIRGR